MRNIKLVMIAFVVVWLQLHFLGAIRPLSVMPNLLLIVIIYAGLVAKATETVGLAIGAGLLIDLASGTDFGLRMAFYSTLALVIIVARRAGADFENIGLVLAATAAGTLVYNLAVLTGLVGSGSHFPWQFLGGRIGAELALNLVLAVAVGPVLAKVLKQPIGTETRVR